MFDKVWVEPIWSAVGRGVVELEAGVAGAALRRAAVLELPLVRERGSDLRPASAAERDEGKDGEEDGLQLENPSRRCAHFVSPVLKQLRPERVTANGVPRLRGGDLPALGRRTRGNLPRQAHFDEEALEQRGVRGEIPRQELQGHRLAELQIIRAVDLSHPAPPERADHPIAFREGRAGRERLGALRTEARSLRDPGVASGAAVVAHGNSRSGIGRRDFQGARRRGRRFRKSAPAEAHSGQDERGDEPDGRQHPDDAARERRDEPEAAAAAESFVADERTAAGRAVLRIGRRALLHHARSLAAALRTVIAVRVGFFWIICRGPGKSDSS